MYQRQFSRNNSHRGRFHRGNRGSSFGRGATAGSSTHSSRYVNKIDTSEVVEAEVIQHKFEDFAIDQRLKQNIIARGYTIPTPIQDRAIPSILEGHDVVGIANTGTGKTAAFLIPLLNKLLKDRTEKVLIIAPTRELAVQIEEEVRAFGRMLGFQSVLIMGGTSMGRQIGLLRHSPSIIIGTPGRLKDLISKRLLNLSQFKNVVLDEVDRMLDIGFIHDIRFIISLLPAVRQSLFFSATLTGEVNTIIRSFVKNPVTISVKIKETAKGVDQDIIRVRDNQEKIAKLNELLKQEEFKKVLIFGRTKWGVERLSKSLQNFGFSAGSIHGNKTQSQRLRVLSQFKQNMLKVLVATDVAARGLDIADVSHVINYDEPSSYTDYIHRIGRTGRANKSGKALTFIG